MLCPLGSVCLFCLICILFVGLWGCSGDGCVGLSGLFCVICVLFWHVHGLWVVGCVSVSSVFLFCIFMLLGLFFSTQVCLLGTFVTHFMGYMGGHLYLQAVPSLPQFNHGKNHAWWWLRFKEPPESSPCASPLSHLLHNPL